jgi:hypothetical protein
MNSGRRSRRFDRLKALSVVEGHPNSIQGVFRHRKAPAFAQGFGPAGKNAPVSRLT